MEQNKFETIGPKYWFPNIYIGEIILAIWHRQVFFFFFVYW